MNLLAHACHDNNVCTCGHLPMVNSERLSLHVCSLAVPTAQPVWLNDAVFLQRSSSQLRKWPLPQQQAAAS